MEIKIKLPHNVKVTCPSLKSAIIILRSISFKNSSDQENQIQYPNSDVSQKSYGPPWATTGRSHDGEAAFVQHDPMEDDNDVADNVPQSEDVEDAEVDSDELESSDGSSFDSSYDEDIDEPDAEHLGDGPDSVLPEFDDCPPTERQPKSFHSQPNNRNKATTRSRFSVRLDRGNVDSSSSASINRIFQPIEFRMKDRVRAVFDFIQTRTSFSTKEVNKHVKAALGTKLSKKNKKKILKSLHSLEKSGKIKKISKSKWKKVA